MNKMRYYHVDVFAYEPMTGNGLTVVFPDEQLDPALMLKITREFKQFETIFVFPELSGVYPVRIFTVEEELEFAGHPMLGAAAVIHSVYTERDMTADILLDTDGRIIMLKSVKTEAGFTVTMNQGQADFICSLNSDDYLEILQASNLKPEDLHPDYPVEVVSTGLPYMLLPVINAIDKIRICRPDFEVLLAVFGAKFAYFFDPETLECRTWDNLGVVEDVATGSAAGPLCAYLVKHGFDSADEDIEIRQGRFIGRASSITGEVNGQTNDVSISGGVTFFSEGEISVLE